MDKKEGFAEAIRRLWSGKTASSLADKAGIKKSTLSEYMNAKRYPREDNFGKLAKALGLNSKQFEEYIWNVRQGKNEVGGRTMSGLAIDPTSDRFREILFGDVENNPRLKAEPRLRNILEEVSASAYHFGVARERLATALAMLIEFVAERP